VGSCLNQARGGDIISGTTHYLFEGNRVKAITPRLVDGGAWSTFELDITSQPKRITMTLLDTGTEENLTPRRPLRWAYELQGDFLLMCWPNVFGIYPDVISDQTHGVITLKRYHGPMPETKQPSGKKPITHAILGNLVWDDDLEWWKAKTLLSSDTKINLAVSTDAGSDELPTIEKAGDFLLWLRSNDEAVRRFAASQLLELYNDEWRENEEKIDSTTFVDRLYLEDATVYSGDDFHAELIYQETADMFAGHCIIVSVGDDYSLEEASLAG